MRREEVGVRNETGNTVKCLLFLILMAKAFVVMLFVPISLMPHRQKTACAKRGAEFPGFSAPKKMVGIILYERNRPATAKVYSEVASTQAEHSSGVCLVQLPWCTVVSGQIDLNTGGGAGMRQPR